LILLANQVAVALDKLLLLDAERKQREYAETLSQTSAMLASTLDPEEVLNCLFDQACQVIPNDAANLRLVEDDLVQVKRWRGYEQYGATRLIEGHTVPIIAYPLYREMIKTGKPLAIPDTTQDSRWIHRPGLEWQRSHVCAPIRVRDNTVGFLSMYSVTPGLYSAVHAERLGAFANHVAVALENARIFSKMQKWNEELSDAYEATIQGWSRALEMRDRETKGHSDRVTRMALRLAQEVGLPDAEIVHFRRGVILHDIGKMVIPDAILLKPGPLTEEEREVIRRHPAYALQMLSGIPFLARSLDVPYSHHENWDGSGYPEHLIGEKIPLQARIFAVVDVWDALTSERPYHPAWSPEVAEAYILSKSGSQFDPSIVEYFIKLLRTGKFK